MRELCQKKGKISLILIWLGPVLLLISLFSWIRPNPVLSQTVNLIFHVLGIIGAILMGPLIFYQFNINIWVTATLGIWCIGLAAYIYSGLEKITVAVTVIIAIGHLFWLFVVWMWSRKDAIEQHRRYLNRIMLEELTKAVNQWDICLYEWSRLTTGLLFLAMTTCACWVVLSAKYFDTSASLIIAFIWAVLLSLFLISACVSILIGQMLHNLANKIENRKNATHVVLSSFILGALICWIPPNLIAGVVFKYKAFWMLNIITFLAWTAVCLLWRRHVTTIIKKSEGVNHYQQIEKMLSK